MAVEGERLICPGSIIRDHHGPRSKTSMQSVRKHGTGLVVQYTVRNEGIEGKEYRVGVIDSRGHFAGTMMVR